MKDLESATYTQFDVMERARDDPEGLSRPARGRVATCRRSRRPGQDNRVFQLLLSGPDLEQAFRILGA